MAASKQLQISIGTTLALTETPLWNLKPEKELFRKLWSIIQFPIYEIKYTKHLETNTKNLKNNSPNQGKHCTKQLKLFPKTKNVHTKMKKFTPNKKKSYTKLITF